MTYNKTVKSYIDKWRQSHREQHNAYLYIKNKEYLNAKRDHINELRRKNYNYKKEAQIFRNILI